MTDDTHDIDPDELDHPTDELQPLGIAVPHDLPRVIGYDDAKGLAAGAEARYIAFWIDFSQSVSVTDGYVTLNGADHKFMSWDRAAGRKFMKEVAATSDDYDTDSLPDDPTAIDPLTTILARCEYPVRPTEDNGYRPGSRDPPTNALLLDIAEKRLYVGEKSVAEAFCKAENSPPEIVDNLPDDPEQAFEALRRAFSQVDQ